jgi:hypothetical protein
VLGLLGLEAGFDEVNEDAAGAGVTGFGQGEDTLPYPRGERDALTDRGVGGGHGFIVQQIGGAWLSGWSKSNGEWVLAVRKAEPISWGDLAEADVNDAKASRRFGISPV